MEEEPAVKAANVAAEEDDIQWKEALVPTDKEEDTSFFAQVPPAPPKTQGSQSQPMAKAKPVSKAAAKGKAAT